MRLVQSVLTDKFILMASETRGIKPDSTIVNNVNKMIKVNNQIVFGCTGGIKDNYILFKEFCDYSEEYGLIPLKDGIDISYNNFVKIISNRFMEMYKLRYRSQNPIPYAIISIVSGYNGYCLETTVFNMEADKDNCIIKVVKPSNFPYKGVSAGQRFHLDSLNENIQNIYMKYGKMTILQCKNALRDTFDKGAKIDKEINNDIHFEIIKLKDMI